MLCWLMKMQTHIGIGRKLEKKLKDEQVQMLFKCTEPTTRCASVRARSVQPLHATKNTVLQLAIWYTARMLPNFADSPICKSPHSLHKCSSRSSLLWYRVVVSLIN
jgi:hypothetical protein